MWMDAPNLLHTFPSYSLQVSLPQYKEHNFFSQNFWPLLFKLIFQIQIQQLSTSHLVKVPLFLFNINAFKNLLCVEKLWLLSDFLKVLFFFFSHRYKASNTDPEFSRKFLDSFKPNQLVNLAESEAFKEDRRLILKEGLSGLSCHPP